jgi:hypothetical protein
MLLVYTGIKRHASSTLEEQVGRTKARQLDIELNQLMVIVEHAHEVLERPGNRMLAELAELLNESWRIKRGLASSVSSDAIDELYRFCLANGALGGKLCGAGGGGFLLMLLPQERRESFLAKVGRRRCVDFKIDMFGTTVLRHGEARADNRLQSVPSFLAQADSGPLEGCAGRTDQEHAAFQDKPKTDHTACPIPGFHQPKVTGNSK